MTTLSLQSGTLQRSSAPIRRWPVVLGGFLLNMSLGTFYAISAFLLPMEKEFGWSRAQTSVATTLGFVMISLWFVVGGYLQDRRGPRLVAAIGSVLFSLGFFLAGEIHSLTVFYLAIGVCVGAGNGFAYVVPMAVGSKWFPDKRGLIVGLMVGGYGAGSGIFGPLASKLIESIGWRGTFRAFSITFFLMMLLATCLVKNPPEGYQPAGWSPRLGKRASHADADVCTSRMIRMPKFWALWAAYCLGTTAGVMVISQLVPFVRASGHGSTVAAFAIIVGAVGNTGGRILSGWASDHIGRLRTLCIVLLVSAVAMPVLFLSRQHTVALYLALGVVYYCYGTQLSVYASTSADFYGTRYLGLNYGILILAWGIAGVIGPLIAGYVYVASGEYRWAFFLAGAVSLAAFVVLFVVKPQKSSESIIRKSPVPAANVN
jgi:MFS transporter, OFA family, oxalate/formate antiporter